LDQWGNRRTLEQFEGTYVVVYFYPKDFTSGCTKEAEAFRDAAERFEALGAKIVGISKDSVESHAKFANKLGLSFPLLSDPDLGVTERYGAIGPKNMYGKIVQGVLRSTFLIGPDGTLLRSWNRVRVPGHIEAVLEALARYKTS